MTLADLAVARKRAGLSQQELAQRSGLSVSYVRLIERGYGGASIDAECRLRSALAGARDVCPHCGGSGVSPR